MKNLEQIIDQWLGEEKEVKCNHTHIKTTQNVVSICYNCSRDGGYNQSFKDLKSRKKELVDGIVNEIQSLKHTSTKDKYGYDPMDNPLFTKKRNENEIIDRIIKSLTGK